MRTCDRVGAARHAGTRRRRLPSPQRTAQCTHDERAASQTPRHRPDVVADVPVGAPRRALGGVRRGRAGRRAGAGPGRLAVACRAAPGSRRPAARSSVPGPRPAEVEVVRDDHGIPQVYADTDADLMRGAGLRARRRSASSRWTCVATSPRGRLSELFGDRRPRDRQVRSAPWAGAGSPSRSWRCSTPRPARRSTAYAEGVNAYLDDARHHRDRRRVHPARRERPGLHARAVDARSTRWPGSRRWRGTCAATWTDEVDRVRRQPRPHARRGRAALPATTPSTRTRRSSAAARVVDGVFEQDATGNATRNPRRAGVPAEPVDAARRAAATRLAQMPDADGPRRRHRLQLLGRRRRAHRDRRSRCWPTTRTSASSMPGIWMQMGLHCRTMSADCTLDVVGLHLLRRARASIIGHNADIAWGFTNLGPDVTDLYLEKIEGERWIQDGERSCRWPRATETIKVRGEDDFDAPGPRDRARPAGLRRVARAQHGRAPTRPSTSRTPTGRGNGYAVALAWTALEPGTTADAILALDRASDWDEFRAAAADFAVPAQNLVYADREGHIGYQAPGRIPIRKSGNDGRLPADGLGAGATTGPATTSPSTALPSVLDPDEGFVVTANQAVVGPGLPLLPHRRLGPRLPLDPDPPAARGGGRALRRRDGRASSSTPPTRWPRPWCPTCSTCRTCRATTTATARSCSRTGTSPSPPTAPRRRTTTWCGATCCALTFHDELPRGGVARRRRPLVRRSSSTCSTDPAGPWWDDVDDRRRPESRDDILRQALMDARDEMTRLRGAATRASGPGATCTSSTCSNQTLGESGIGAGRVAAQPRRLRGRRRLQRSSTPTGWDAARGLRGHLGAVDADGGLAGRPRRLPLDQPHRRLGPRRSTRTTPTRPTCGRRGDDPAVGLLAATPSRPPPRTRCVLRPRRGRLTLSDADGQRVHPRGG